MTWLVFALGAAIFWGFYGVALQTGQIKLQSPMKALLCVGLAYFLIGMLVPIVALSGQKGGFSGFNVAGTTLATLGGLLGAAGAVCIIYAFKAHGSPAIVMSLVFGGAPLINVLVSMIVNPPAKAPDLRLWLGYVLASSGVALVLLYRPQH